MDFFVATEQSPPMRVVAVQTDQISYKLPIGGTHRNGIDHTDVLTRISDLVLAPVPDLHDFGSSRIEGRIQNRKWKWEDCRWGNIITPLADPETTQTTA